MAWGGGGGGGGGHFFGGGGHPGSSQPGLPFAGIPPELLSRVERLVENEPEHHGKPEEGEERFSHSRWDRRPLTLRRFLAPHRWAMIGAFALVVIETAAMQAGPLLTQIGIDEGIRKEDIGIVVLVSMLYFGSVGINAVASWGRIAWTGRVGERLMYRLRVRVFSHFQRLSVDFFTEEKAGRLMTRMTSDIESLTQLFHDGMVQMAVQLLTIVFVTAALFWFNVQLAAFTMLVVLPGMIVLTVWFRSASERGYLRVRERLADVLAHLQETLSGIRIVTAHNRQRHNIVEHRNIAGVYRDANDYTAKVGAIYGPGSEFIGIAGQAFILFVGGNMVLDGSLEIGELAAFVLYLTSFFAPIQQMVQLYDTYQRGQAAITKLRELLLTAPTVAEAPDAYVLPPIDGAIRFEHVTFGYDPERPVLRDIKLTIAAGETFALVGPTGAGKSTIAKLVVRFHDPTSGRVLIDGHDLHGVTLTSLRRQLGVVPQEPFLFSGSIRDNVAFTRPDASDEEVLEACAAVGIDDLVARLPDGIHTPCHERGISLSSGERQLLALARAFLAHPRVLVLDEATSNLDLRSEAKIEHALDVLLEGRTAIVIAHRLQTAMRADRIAVVDDGRIVELGSHDELVALAGRYAEMYRTWESHAGAAPR